MSAQRADAQSEENGAENGHPGRSRRIVIKI